MGSNRREHEEFFRSRSIHRAARGFRLALTIAALLLLVGTSCGRKAKAPPPLIPSVGERQTGLASWYGNPFHGRQTASGEIYNMNGFTAAHRTLPFHTWVRVTNLENQRFTTVRINDRGPFIEGRIIDLSRAAADAIGMLGTGTALVRLEIVEDPEMAANPPRYAVQVGAFLAPENARQLQGKLSRKYGDVYVQTYERPDGLYYRVLVGRNVTRQAAETLAGRLRREPGIAAAFVLRLN